MSLLQGGLFAPLLLYVGGLSRLNTLIEQSCKYSNNAVKCITTILALNLTAIKGTSNVNCSTYWEILSLYAHCNFISFMFVLKH